MAYIVMILKAWSSVIYKNVMNLLYFNSLINNE